MYSTYLFLALDTARERAAEADRNRLAAESRSGRHVAIRARRLVERAAAAVARAADDAYDRAATLPS